MADTVKVGPWGAPGGQCRDINAGSRPQRLKTITISCGPENGRIVGFSFCYDDENQDEIERGPWGTIDPDNSVIIGIGENEQLNFISGTFNNNDGITSLKLKTNQAEYGPYGFPARSAFSVPLQAGAGEVVAFFGRSNDSNNTLFALGVYVLGRNGLPVMIGPWGRAGNTKYINTPVLVKSITVHSTQRINGFSFTYVDRNGRIINVHPWGVTNGEENTIHTLPIAGTFDANGEYVNNITGSFDANGVTSLQFTTNQQPEGYDLYGRCTGTNFSVLLPDNAVVGNRNGAVLGFFGRPGGDGLDALGVYVGVAPQP